MPGFLEIDEDKVKHLLGEPEAVAWLEAAVGIAANVAKEICPVSDGDHRDAIFGGNAKTGPDGATAEFGSTSSTWHILEYGTATNPPYRVMTQAAERVGLTFKPE